MTKSFLRICAILLLTPLFHLQAHAGCSSFPTFVQGTNPSIPFGTSPADPIDCELRVPSGQTLILDATTLYFSPDGSLVVEAGALLRLNNCALLPVDESTLWGGIRVLGNGNVPFNPSLQNQGVARLFDTRIRNAEVGVGSGYQLPPAQQGGVIQLTRCSIENPGIFGVFWDESGYGFATASHVEDCDFSIDRSDWGTFEAMMALHQVINLPVSGTGFHNSMPPSTSGDLQINERGTAIRATEAQFTVTQCQFFRFKKGIEAIGSLQYLTAAEPIEIRRCGFFDCLRGAEIHQQDEVFMFRDTVKLSPDYMAQTLETYALNFANGVILNRCFNPHIESCLFRIWEPEHLENSLIGFRGLEMDSTNQAIVRNCRFDIEARITGGFWMFPEYFGLQLTGDQTNSSVTCNEFFFGSNSSHFQYGFTIDAHQPVEFGGSSSGASNNAFFMPFGGGGTNTFQGNALSTFTSIDLALPESLDPSKMDGIPFTQIITTTPGICTSTNQHFGLPPANKSEEIKGNEEEDLSIYPNPAAGCGITLEWPGRAGSYAISLIGADGREVHRQSWHPESGAGFLSTTGLAAGVYFLRLVPRNGGLPTTRKLIIQ